MNENEDIQNEDLVQGQWVQRGGRIKPHRGMPTEDDLKITEGNAEYLVGKLQERYGTRRTGAHVRNHSFERAADRHGPAKRH